MVDRDWSLTMPSRHKNDDGSLLIVAQVTDDATGEVGMIRVEVDPDGGTRAYLEGDAGLIPLGMWDVQ